VEERFEAGGISESAEASSKGLALSPGGGMDREELLQFTEFALRKSSVATFWIDEEGHFILVNEAACRDLGYSMEEFANLTVADIAPGFTPGSRALMWKSLKDHGTLNYESVHRRKDGTLFPVELTIQYMEYRDRSFVVAYAVDITARKIAEAVLIESEEKYRTLFEASTDAILVEQLEGKILDCNQAACRMSGYTRGEHQELTVADLIPENLAAMLPEIIKRELENGGVFIEALGKRKDGTIFPTEVSTMTVNLKGELRVIAYVRDISARRQAEERVKAALREKDIMLKEIHHRVKNNLQTVSSLLNLQSESISDPCLREVFEESKRRVRAMAFVHEKLYQSRDLARVEFSEYLQDLVSYLIRSLDRQGISYIIHADRLSLTIDKAISAGLIVNELLSNSLKHAFPGTRGGSIVICLGACDDCHALLSIKDNGIGFPDDIDYKNTESLGMQLVNDLVGQLDGTIELTSDQGTCFSVTFRTREVES